MKQEEASKQIKKKMFQLELTHSSSVRRWFGWRKNSRFCSVSSLIF